MGADGQETTNDMYHENTMMSKENSNLRTRIKAMQETIDVLTAKNAQLLADKEVKSTCRSTEKYAIYRSHIWWRGVPLTKSVQGMRQLIYFLENGNSATIFEKLV